MPASKLWRVSIGFAGGQVLAARVLDKDLTALKKALDGREGWHPLAAEDGEVALDLAQVVYLRVDSDEARVGFGS